MLFPVVMAGGYLFAGALDGGWLPNLWVLLVALLSYAAGRSEHIRRQTRRGVPWRR